MDKDEIEEQKNFDDERISNTENNLRYNLYNNTFLLYNFFTTQF